MNSRINKLKEKMQTSKRYATIEQALIITKTYKENEDKPKIIKRALALKNSLEQIQIGIEDEELIVGNRTKGVRYGIIFPESGISWVDKEYETLPNRPQDKFNINEQDIKIFREEIVPYWKDKTLEDIIKNRNGKENDAIVKVVKINQKDHAQGHICPNVKSWLNEGIENIKQRTFNNLKDCQDVEQKNFYESVILTMEGAQSFIMRYHDLAVQKAAEAENPSIKQDLLKVATICKNLSKDAPTTFHEALQSVWFLFVILHMESNASSFSPGRMDQYLYPFYKNDIEKGILTPDEALELIECIWIKFNEIVYLRNSHSAKFFAGFPIGFNIAIGGIDEFGNDASNELSTLFLQAQNHLGLPQPNLSVRLHKNTPSDILVDSIKVVAKGSGMPQFFNDESIINSMIDLGISKKDARDYAIVGCVELTAQGNALGWSDAAMFNLNKALELTLNNGVCLLTGEQIGIDVGNITSFKTYEELEEAFKKQIDHFIDRMISACEVVEKAHMEVLPSPFLSSVIDDCIKKGKDVTAGGAVYNLSGIQMIQVANLVDSLVAIKKLVYDEGKIDKQDLLDALRQNFEGHIVLKNILLNKAPKYGNDIDWVDEIGVKWARYFRDAMDNYTNFRGGKYHTGMYTVSAHVPMGENVGASPDGRNAQEPLADGGMSPVYGRDVEGPTAVLKSVSKLDNYLTTNGGLLNMKFLPEFFSTETGINKFASFLRTFVDLEIPHIQFNVLNREDLLEAKKNPEQYQNLTVRVAGYTAYFVELDDKLQNEIIARTAYENI
ncbi:pyruvate formate-lyase [Candidatus Epulonipiscium fishelsonii]|uniref:Pyruvate formate-lyase n=1 Tax=Candidatus Epulonipiscium fishelsonii TaxID=77094 RepID=A0ACC8XGR9_9FIRM|nr:pyruvate formate-lyase [Epulopiscium sp. SCG-B05WGA-EpuloA1]ONI42832.1 pyruvate formate-lyase [Epulopiscium sp. SCG-B11WGA-EpuloA1]